MSKISDRYTPALARELCAAIAEGATLASLCRARHLSYWPTSKYLRGKHSELYKEAFESRLSILEDRLIDLCAAAQDAAACCPANAAAAAVARAQIDACRLEIDTIKWQLAALLSHRYGVKNKVEVTGKDGAPLLPAHTAEQDAAYLSMLAAVQKKLDAAAAAAAPRSSPEAS